MRFARHSKYRAAKTVVDGIEFDSKAEAKRWSELRLLERAEKIKSLERQPRYDFIINGVKLGFYKADFRYFDMTKKRLVVEDVKGFRTPVYTIKAKLMRALHDIEVVEVGRSR